MTVPLFFCSIVLLLKVWICKLFEVARYNWFRYQCPYAYAYKLSDNMALPASNDIDHIHGYSSFTVILMVSYLP